PGNLPARPMMAVTLATLLLSPDRGCSVALLELPDPVAETALLEIAVGLRAGGGQEELHDLPGGRCAVDLEVPRSIGIQREEDVGGDVLVALEGQSEPAKAGPVALHVLDRHEVGVQEAPAGAEHPGDLAIESVDVRVQTGRLHVHHHVEEAVEERQAFGLAVDEPGVRILDPPSTEQDGARREIQPPDLSRGEKAIDRQDRPSAAATDVEDVAVVQVAVADQLEDEVDAVAVGPVRRQLDL